MDADSFRRAAEYIVEVVGDPRFGWTQPHGQIGIHYVGGEILTVPKLALRDIVMTGREVFSQHFADVTDGVQTNLIGPPARISNLQALFGKRISTSVDSFGSARTVKGSADLYRSTVAVSLNQLRRRNFTVPAIFVADTASLPNMHAEIELAEREGRSLRLRPVFQGGSQIRPAANDALASAFGIACRGWLMHGTVILEPFMQLLSLRLPQINGLVGEISSGCPFSNNCSRESLSLDADGSLHTCQDMCDAGLMPLGNALRKEFDWDAHALLASRNQRLPEDCRSCAWVDACRGGCTMEALSNSGRIDGKTPHCGVWKACFREIDAAVDEYGADAVAEWARELR